MNSAPIGEIPGADAGSMEPEHDAPLPCPFCGAVASVVKAFGSETAYVIGCDYDDCDVSPNVRGDDEGDAIQKWNKRKGVGV